MPIFALSPVCSSRSLMDHPIHPTAWNDPDMAKLPVYEPGLDAVVGRARREAAALLTVDQRLQHLAAQVLP